MHVWPAITDLVLGIALTTVVLLFVGVRQNSDGLRALDEARREAEEARNELIRTREALEAAKRTLGVGREVVERLQGKLADAGIEARVNPYGNLEVSADMLFGIDEDAIPEQKRADALRLGSVVVDLLTSEELAPAIAVLSVVGHTDQVGTKTYNRSLSVRRALALVDLWQAELSPPPCAASKVVASGFGEERPLVLDETSAQCGNQPADRYGCRANRRIELRVTPKQPSVAEISGCP